MVNHEAAKTVMDGVAVSGGIASLAANIEAQKNPTKATGVPW